MDAIQARERYFKDYKLKVDEQLTAEYELLCKSCGSQRYFQKDKFIAICLCKCQVEAGRERERQKELVERMEQLKSLKAVSFWEQDIRTQVLII